MQSELENTSTEIMERDALRLLTRWADEHRLLEISFTSGPVRVGLLGEVEGVKGNSLMLNVPPRCEVDPGEPGFLTSHLCGAHFRREQRANIDGLAYSHPRDVLHILLAFDQTIELSAVSSEELSQGRPHQSSSHSSTTGEAIQKNDDVKRVEQICQYVGVREGETPCRDCDDLTKFKVVGLDTDECTWPGCKRQMRHVAAMDAQPGHGPHYMSLRVVIAAYCDKHYEERQERGTNLPPEVLAFENERRTLFEIEKALVAPEHVA